jgi:hypothetical protein
VLHELIVDGGVKNQDIVILSTRNERTSSIWKQRKFGNFELVSHPRHPEHDQIVFSSLRRFKGLEADVIILCEINPTARVSSPEDMYVGTSRAKHILGIIRYDGELRTRAGAQEAHKVTQAKVRRILEEADNAPEDPDVPF